MLDLQPRRGVPASAVRLYPAASTCRWSPASTFAAEGVRDAAWIVPARLRPVGPVLDVVPARPEKTAIGPGLGRQSGTMPDTTRHEEPIGPHSVGPLSVGPFRARAGLGPGGPFGILYSGASKVE
jgi:hypothetical protein